MEILKVEKHSAEELLARLRRVGMFTDPDRHVYRDCTISLEKIRPEFLSPPQTYVLTGELLKVRQLRWALREHGIDLFALDGYVSIHLAGCDEPVDVLPPVVEESIEADGRPHLLICDGMHRVTLARQENLIPQVIYVRGLPADLPYYAYPVPGGWAAVEMREDLPPGYIKKWHRIKNYKTLYRDFNTAFLNVGGPRGNFVKQG